MFIKLKIFYMKRIVAIFGILVSASMFSQASRFVYQVTMKPDANNKSDVKTEVAYLDATPTKSIFVGENRVKRDSLINRMRTTGSFNREQIGNFRSNIDFTVEKDLMAQKSTFRQRIGRDLYEYDEDRNFNWKILPETVKIGEYKTQKATTQFGGRTWNAWFTTDIPFQDGPYKFAGLPGLIVKVEDEDGDYSFDLKETKKINDIANVQERGNPIKLKKSDFDKQNERYRKDPISFFSAQAGGMGGRGGRFQADPQRMKEMENRIKETIAKTNNPIELN